MLALAGIRRLVVQTRAIKIDDLLLLALRAQITTKKQQHNAAARRANQSGSQALAAVSV